MTDAEKAFEREVREQLKRRARIVREPVIEIRRLLGEALTRVLAVLAGQPSDYQLWSLPQLVKEIGVVAGELGAAATAAAAKAAQASWTAGADLVVQPLAAAGLAPVTAVAPHIDVRQLRAMQAFMADRLENVSLSAANKINSELGLVVIGAQDPYAAQVAIRGLLKGSVASRATTIVRTELLRVYSTAGAAAMDAAAEAGVAMDKVWRRSSKAHPRVSHALADGQRVAREKPFLVGGVAMMHPHDPKAPPAETINCGCVAVPKPRDWKPTMPDHKPFTADELARNPTLKTVVEGRAELTGEK